MATKNSDKVLLHPSYINFPRSANLTASASIADEDNTKRYVNLGPAFTTVVVPEHSQGRPLKERQSLTRSEPALHQQPQQPPNGLTDSSDQSKRNLLNAKLSESGKDCSRCLELEQLLAMWDFRVSELTRNFSKILAQLSKTRGAALGLESKIRQQAHRATPDRENSPQRNNSLTVNASRKLRSSMYDPTTVPNQTETLVDQMYPQTLEESLTNWHSLPPQYAKHITDLNTHLGEAIDFCQQLVAASFRTDYPRDLKNGPDNVRRGSQPLLLQHSAPTFQPTLKAIAEDFPRRKLTRQLSAPSSLTESIEMESDSDSGDTLKRAENGEVPPSSSSATQDTSDEDGLTSTQPFSGRETRTELPFYNRMMTLMSEDDRKEAAVGGEENGGMEENSQESPDYSQDSLVCRGSMLSRSSTFSDSDVKQVMSKIADLEQERVKLLETIDQLQISNQQVRQSLIETLGDLENKDLQLTLAMQDLSIATDEIKMAASMRKQMESLSVEREALLERLNGLEDESAAVKVSLIQLLQEKSATNKTLALENWRLSQRMRANSFRRGGSRVGSVGSRSGVDSDNLSMISREDDIAMQEAVMQLDDPGNFVHKQGFLTKQGARVKTWKRRLFVLDSHGLSYFKTEQPIQTLPLSSICEVQVCHGRTPLPHMFELHTPGRVFLLSAQSQDDMQSWIGMLQTLKQYNQARQPRYRTLPPPQTTSQSDEEQTPATAPSMPRPMSDPSLDSTLKLSPLHPLGEDEIEEDEVEEGATLAKSVPSSSLLSEEGEATLNIRMRLTSSVATGGGAKIDTL